MERIRSSCLLHGYHLPGELLVNTVARGAHSFDTALDLTSACQMSDDTWRSDTYAYGDWWTLCTSAAFSSRVAYFFALLVLVAIISQPVVHLQHGFDVVNFFSYFTNLSNIFACAGYFRHKLSS